MAYLERSSVELEAMLLFDGVPSSLVKGGRYIPEDNIVEELGQRMRVGLAVIILAAGLVLSGCAGAPADGPDIKQGSLEQTKIELRAIDAVGDARPAGAAYFPDERTIYIKLYVINNPITDAEIQEAQEAAEQELDGLDIRVVIKLEYGPQLQEE